MPIWHSYPFSFFFRFFATEDGGSHYWPSCAPRG